jgi:hypothetical protein
MSKSQQFKQHAVQALETKIVPGSTTDYIGSILYFGLWVTVTVFIVWNFIKIIKGERRETLGHVSLYSLYLFTIKSVAHGKSIFADEDIGYILLAYIVSVGWIYLRGNGESKWGGTFVLRGGDLVYGERVNAILWDKKALKKIKKINSKVDIRIGDVIIPPALEAQHILFSGTTGSGKTQAISKLLRSVRVRARESKSRSRALIADASGGFLSRFYERGDFILNPFDTRSAPWSPFAEIRSEYDCQRIAKAAIPDGNGDSQEWHHYAQTLLSETMLAMFKKGMKSVKKLLHYLTVADQKELGELLAGTPAAILCVRANEKMLGNTRGIIATYLVAWRYLQDEGTFSVRDWVCNENAGGWLFITYRDDQMGLLRILVATMLELGIVEALSLSEDSNRDLWFFFDEVDSLGKVSSLRAGLTKLRKYGGKVVLGLQTISQLRTTYGKDEAQTLLANVSTKLILRAGDGETAEYFSDELGMQEIERQNTSYSNGKSASVTQSFSYEYRRTVLASQISGLSNLTGYLKIPSAPIGLVSVPYEEFPQITPAFVEAGVGKVAVSKPEINSSLALNGAEL